MAVLVHTYYYSYGHCHTGGTSSNRTAFPYFRVCGPVSVATQSLEPLHSQNACIHALAC